MHPPASPAVDSESLPEGASEGLPYADLLQQIEGSMRRLCPSWLADSRDDLVQMALIKVMEIARRDEKSTHFSSSYLWRVAHSVLIDEIRRARRRSEVALDETEPSKPRGLSMASPTAGPQQRLFAGELRSAIRDCLGGLIDNRRRVVTLHLEGSSPDEISDILGWKTKKVYNAVHRGLHDLRDCLRQKDLTP